MRFGIMIVPEDRWQTARLKWRQAEQMGFDHAWTYDHLNWRAFRAKDWFTAVPTLTAAAVETERIGLGVLVASPNLRHPVSLAKDVTAIDDISGGRLILGLGSGAEGFDSTMTRRAPWSRRERTARFAEYVQLTDLLLRQPVTTFDGRYYVAHEVYSYPLCQQEPRVPFAIAASGARGMRLVAEYGSYWVTTGEPNRFASAPYEQALPVLRQQVEALEKACLEIGRDPATVARLLVTGPTVGGVLASPEAFFDAAGRFAEAGITDVVVQWPRPDEPFPGKVEVLEKVAEDLDRHRIT
ncbi:LLM class flavin-dependent oxidoreductase [Dactylosporangium fulvum]|uniref:LLM class flavin-dependent oxidoreductase n=1 Tax=Dactylosporangium fulvum TaxID=53359 RepID=A0ABY5VQW6_9ACTN|nr:LLM class flavin-dependent oxidoreductase [Dactylosporangium fulvum]UWP80167.1 LLM class flavin-dependent oxidoreductase [Dactylosporangium fulvum]